MPSRRSGALRRAERLPTALPVALLAAALLVAGCAAEPAETTDGGGSDSRYISGDGTATSFDPGERVDAPEYTGETLDGDEVSLSDYEGGVLVLNVWASWCGPCRSETPVLNEVHGDFADRGVDFLGVNIKDDRTAAEAFERKQEVAYPSLYDQPGEVPQAFRDTVPPQAIPSTLVIDREGRIAARVIGETNYDQLTGLVETVVEEGE